MKILVLNCGSSSIKYQLLEMGVEPDLLAIGLLERVGLDDSVLKHEAKGKEKYKSVQPCSDHQIGINLIIDMLLHPEHGVLKSKEEIAAVGHRVVHGGVTFSKSAEVTEGVIKEIEECADLAPLHNPANLKGIYAMKKLLPDIPQCVVFDTAFHQTMPEHAYMYALPYELYSKYKIRKYGFHGTSHRFVAEKACKILDIDINSINIITCHLGNGASMTAIKKGKSFDTSMGLTPNEGLIMGTRTGDLDLGALLYLMEKENLDFHNANNLVNKKSGVHGISGISMDMRDLHTAAEKGNKRAKLALDMYAYRVKKYIGAYAAAMDGVDLIIYTGGIGENDFFIREWSCSGLEFMGVEFNKEANHGVKGRDIFLSKPGSKVKVMSITTNEELVIATDTMRIVSELKK